MIRILLVLGGGAAVLLLLLLQSITQGLALDWLGAFRVLFEPPQDQLEHHILRGMRLPRAVMAMLSGAALAAAGVLLQTVTRNPLASAGTFGINAGAYFIIVAAAVFFPAVKASFPLPLAFVGGAGAAVMAYMLAGGKRGTPVRMALSGMIVTLVLSAFTSAMQLLYENETNGLFLWGSGSLIQNDWSGVTHAGPWIAAGLLIILFMARRLDVLMLSEETAASLGQRGDSARLAALAFAVLLAAATVSVVGPIGFVGLIAPHLVRLIGLHRHTLLLPASALWGANVLLAADIVSRGFRSVIGELPAGVVTAVIGAPWLIWLALRSARRGPEPGGFGSTMSVGALRWKPSFRVVMIGTLVLLGAAVLFSLSVGGIRIPMLQTALALVGQGEPLHIKVLELRVPRIAVSLLAGCGLAAAGAAIQSAVRNPLADPSIIGVTSGAGVGALTLLMIFPATVAAVWLPAAAAVGAFASAALVYALAWRKGLNATVLILVGIAVTALNSAVIHFLVIKSGMGAAPALAWLAGSTYGRGWSEAARLAIMIALFLPPAFLLGRRADLLAFGDQTAVGVGLRLQQTRMLAAGLGVALSAASVSTVGTIGFIGLLAPHMARVLVGHSFSKLVPAASVIGALLLVLADAAGRTMLAPKEIPAGLVVALVGTPYILFLMARSRKGA